MKSSNTSAGKQEPAGCPKSLVSMNIILGLVAAALFGFGLQGFLYSDWLAPKEFWWLLTVAIGTAILSFSAFTDWQKAGIIAATFVAGLGVQLALKDPFWFQQVRLRPTSGFTYLMLATLGLQGVVSALILLKWNILRAIPKVIYGLGVWRVLLVLALLVLASRSAMEPIALQKPMQYLKELFKALVFLALNITSFIAFVIALPGDKLQTLSDRITKSISFPGSQGPLKRFDKTYPIFTAGFVLFICTLIAVIPLEAVPHLDDIVYLFQARIYADGLIALPIPPSTEAFDHYLMDTYGDAWFAVMFPGWPLALALGVLVKMPWIINPMLAAGSILLLHSIVTRMVDRGTANFTILLMAVSPWYLSTSSTQLLHTFTYALILGAWVLLIKARNRPSNVLPLVAGALMGWLFLTRPLEGILIGTLTGLWLLFNLRAHYQWKTVVLYSIGAIVVGITIFPYHLYLTGDLLVTPLNAYYEEFWGPGSNALGFGPNIGAVPDWGSVDVYPGHSPVESLINAHQNLYEVNSSFLGWGGASLVFVFIFGLWGKWTKLSTAMMIVIFATIGLYTLYWFYGGFYSGARYWFLTLVPLLMLTTFGITSSIREFERVIPDAKIAPRISAGIALLCLCSVLVFESWLGFNRYPGINKYHADYQMLSKQDQFRNALVFINTDSDREYGSAFWLNNFSQNSVSPLFARDMGLETNRQIASTYSDRKIFFVDGRSKTNPRVTILRGPVASDDLE